MGFFDADPVEGGWEDSPRFVPLEGGAVEDICDLVRTAWMSRAYLDLAEIAEAMALNADGKALRERGEEIRSDLLEHFLVEEDGLFADRIITDTGAVASDVRSPAGTVPVALHLATKTAAETAAEHILDGNGLWGTWNGSSAYMMAVPSLAYDDRRLNVHEDGHRMRGQVWPWHAYMAWRALVVSGRTGEAERLRDRVLGMLDEHADEGLYEAYDFFDGGPGFGPQGKLEDGSYAPPVIQHAVTAAAVLRLILRR